MKTKPLAIAAFSCIVLALPLSAQEAKMVQGHGMEQFMVIEKHTPADCIKEIESVSAKGTPLLDKFEWGCKWGNHTGYAILEATNEAAVREMLPPSMHDVQIIRVSKFTPAQVKELHEKKG